PGLRQVLRLMGPATIGAAAVQVNVFVNNNFASYLGDGPVSWLNVAFRFMQLPIGLFGVAIGTVTLPVVSRYGARGHTAAFATSAVALGNFALLYVILRRRIGQFGPHGLHTLWRIALATLVMIVAAWGVDVALAGALPRVGAARYALQLAVVSPVALGVFVGVARTLGVALPRPLARRR